MRRLRLTRAEMEKEAMRLASKFVANLPGASTIRCIGAQPDSTAPRSPASKHPVAWLVVFKAPQRSGVVMDGGELFVAVNLETGEVSMLE